MPKAPVIVNIRAAVLPRLNQRRKVTNSTRYVLVTFTALRFRVGKCRLRHQPSLIDSAHGILCAVIQSSEPESGAVVTVATPVSYRETESAAGAMRNPQLVASGQKVSEFVIQGLYRSFLFGLQLG